MADSRISLPIDGLECGACAGVVQRRLLETAGVRSASVNFATRKATVVLQPDQAQVADLVRAVREVGYDCAEASLTLDVEGVCDASGVARLEQALTALRGVTGAVVDQLTETVNIEYLPGMVSIRDIRHVTADQGFRPVQPVSAESAAERERMRYVGAVRGLGWKLSLALLLMLLTTVASMPLLATATSPDGLARLVAPLQPALRGLLPQLYDLEPLWLQVGTATVALIVMLVVAGPIYAGARRGLQFRLADANMLIAFALTVLFGYSVVVVAMAAVAPLAGLPTDVYFESVVGILAFVMLGRLLEARMRFRAAEPIATIVDGALTPPDGLDEDEPEVRDTAPVRIARIVSEAHKRKASIQQRIEEIAGVYVPAVMAVAVAAFLGWMWLGPQPAITYAVLSLVGVLVWAAPGMLSLATPTAVTTAVGRGVELGVLFRGGDVVEKIRRIDTLVFHKTNALTEGTSTVTHVVGAQRADDTTVSSGEILQVAAAVEAHASHPIATAIVQEAREKGVEIAGVARFIEMQGRGVRGIVGKFLVEVISVRHARERSLQLGRLAKEVDRHVLQGRKPVVVVVNDTVRGLIIVSDPIKANAKEAIERLRGLGFTLFMLSGDSKAMARLVAKEIGIERVVAEVEPANKADEIKRLQDDGRVVGVVGDGVTHALALAQADVGFAIGTGPDIATKASDATLTRGDLTGLVTTIQLARKTMRVIRANAVLTAGYNIVGIPLAAGLLYPVTGIVLHPVLAAAAMSVASAGILANCARIRRFTPTNQA